MDTGLSKNAIDYNSMNRLLIPLFFGFPPMFLGLQAGYMIFGFLAFIFSGMALDWWYYSHKKYKDFDCVRKKDLQAAGITPEQMDAWTHYKVKKRRYTFITSVFITGVSIPFLSTDPSDFKMQWQLICISTYMIITAFMFVFEMIAYQAIAHFRLKQSCNRTNSKDDKADMYFFLPPGMRDFGPLLWMGSNFFGYNPLRSTSSDSHQSAFSDDHSRPLLSHDIRSPDFSTSFSNAVASNDFSTPSFSDSSFSNGFSSMPFADSSSTSPFSNDF